MFIFLIKVQIEFICNVQSINHVTNFQDLALKTLLYEITNAARHLGVAR